LTQILKRVSESLVTVVRGSEKDHAKAQADKDLMKKKMDIGSALHDALSLDGDIQKEAIKKIIKGLSK